MEYVYSVVFILGLIISGIVTPLSIKISSRLGYMDKPSERKMHNEPIPYGGGVAILISLVIVVMVLVVMAKFKIMLPQSLSHFIDIEVILQDVRILFFLSGAVFIFALGLFDDIFEMPAKMKLFFQMVIIGTVLYGSSTTMSFFIHNPVIGFIGTLLWVVLITNAFNLIDNMDGICAGVSIVTLLTHFVLLVSYQQNLVALLTVIVCAPLCVFMFFNKPKAKVYLGDAGSLLLGYLIAILSIMSTYYREGQHLSTFFTPLLVLSVPLFDVLTVMLIRYKLGVPFFKADKNHFTHRLKNLGFNANQVLISMMGITVVMGLGAIWLNQSNNFQSVIIFTQALFIFIVIAYLEAKGFKNKDVRK
jgi:UDP-GlcNAc:undecaprenyl-phosphate/decaprenyl-phosphate GlcNAc-1-phosphate transferase